MPMHFCFFDQLIIRRYHLQLAGYITKRYFLDFAVDDTYHVTIFLFMIRVAASAPSLVDEYTVIRTRGFLLAAYVPER